MDVKDAQRRRLDAIIERARRIQVTLQPLLDAHGDRVHFRPSSRGVAMVGLLRDWPQRGKGGLNDLSAVAGDFEAMFATHCRNIEHGRKTGEKALQSFLIRESYKRGRRMEPINASSCATNGPVELSFVTDEIALPLSQGAKTVCDLLALRRDAGRCTPVLIELKDARALKRLVEQVEGYAALIDEHANQFAALYGAVLGETVQFDGPVEKWIVWPAAGLVRDPREEELAARRIRVVGYEERNDGYTFRIGRACA